MEWLEAEGESVDAAVQAAVEALGLQSKDQVDVEVIREPKKGFLGLGSQMALVKVTQRPARRRRRRRGRGGRQGGENRTGSGQKSGGRSNQKSNRGNGSRQGGDNRRGSQDKVAAGDGSARTGSNRPGGGQQRRERRSNKPSPDSKRQEAAVTDDNGREKADIGEQAEVAVEFLEGLIDAFGLEGDVSSKIDDDVLYLNVDGDTEALIGNRGAIMQSVLELTRTVVQRKTFGAPRMRLDIAGYAERRREALQIYAGRLAEKIVADGGEVMLEPMNPADRKVVHDAIGEIDGVRSYSEGEDPNRSVVIAATEDQ